MNKIELLSPSVIEKLSANESIENVFSIVKELVENSLDSNADEIEIRLEDTGRRKITVDDNGSGIRVYDLPLTIKQFTSSKTLSLKNVNFPTFYGFRGEALYSISAVSKVTIQTRTSECEHGWEYNNISMKPRPASRNFGTTVIVEDLFYNTPGRKSFLENKRIELENIKKLLIDFSILLPKVRFLLISNNRTIHLLNEKMTLEEKIRKRLRVPEESLEIKVNTEFRFKNGFVKVKGNLFIHDKKECNVLFFNSRKTSLKGMQKLIKRAYTNVTSKTKASISYMLFIEFEPYDSDTPYVNFNYHPRKEEISISSFTDWNTKLLNALIDNIKEQTSFLTDSIIKTPDFNSKIVNINALGQAVGQVHGSWIISQTEYSMYIIDQHAAHERVIYEKMKHQYLNNKNVPFKEIYPVFIDDDVVSKVVVERYESAFKKIGFIFKEEDSGVYLKGIPVHFIDNIGWKAFFTQEFDILIDYESSNLDSLNDRVFDLANKACKLAIKANRTLTISQMNLLLRDIERTPNGHLCNHGRQSIRKLTYSDIEKLFDRN